MSTIHLNLTTTATPEQFLAALTDFGPGRSTSELAKTATAVQARDEVVGVERLDRRRRRG